MPRIQAKNDVWPNYHVIWNGTETCQRDHAIAIFIYSKNHHKEEV